MLAERLNTGVATLYGYVRGREHLLELVAERLARKNIEKQLVAGTPPKLSAILGDYRPTLERIIAAYELEFAEQVTTGVQ